MKHDPEAFEAALAAYRLPDAPLAMPRQRLERRRRRFLVWIVLRNLLTFARP